MHPYKLIIIKKKLKKSWDTFFSGIKIKTVPDFRHKQISSSHYHETHFYTILKYFKQLKRNHANVNYLNIFLQYKII